MKDVRERFIADVKTNAKVSRFNEALVGMSLWVLIGMFDLPIYATILKVTQMVGKVLCGYIEKEVANKSHMELCEISFKAEIAKTFIYSIGHILVAVYFNFGMAMIVFGNLFNGVSDALLIVFRDRVVELLHSTPENRSTFRADIKIVGSKAHIVGLILNLVVMTYSQVVNINRVDTIKILLVFYGFTGIVDLYVSYRELRTFKNLIKNNTIEEL